MRSAEEREKVMKKKRKKMKKKLVVEGGADPLDEDSVKLTVAEEMTSLTSLSSQEKIRYIPIYIYTSVHRLCT